MTLSMMGLFATLGMNGTQHSGQYCYAECRNYLNVLLSVIMRNVAMLSVIMLGIVILSVVTPL